jgi:hypothetical protein
MLAEGASAGELRQLITAMSAGFRDKAPLSAAGAAAVILDGVRSGAWRILVGEDAQLIDRAVRASRTPPTTTPSFSGATMNPGTRQRPSRHGCDQPG